MQEEISQWAKEKHTDQPNHSKSFNSRASSHIRGLTSRSAKSTGKELPGFRLATLRQLLPGLERDDCTHLAGAKGALPAPASPRPAPPGFTFPSSFPAAPGGVPRRQVPTFPPLGGAELPGPPRPPGERAGAGAAGGARRRRASGAAGRGGGRSQKSPRRAGRTGRPSPRSGATQTPRSPARIAPGQRPHPGAPLVQQAGSRREGNLGDAGSPAPVTCGAHTPPR